MGIDSSSLKKYGFGLHILKQDQILFEFKPKEFKLKKIQTICYIFFLFAGIYFCLLATQPSLTRGINKRYALNYLPVRNRNRRLTTCNDAIPIVAVIV